MNTWILVADGAHARIFNTTTATSALTEIESIDHPETQQREQALTSDLPGRQAGGSKGGHHSVESQTAPKEYEGIKFARELCRHLESAHNEQKFRQLIVIAAPSFLGCLRDEMSDNISKVVVFELDKDIVKLDNRAIRQHLPAILPRLST